MISYKAAALAIALGGLLIAAAPALADGSFSSGASSNGGSTRVSVGFSGRGFGHGRRGPDTGFGGSNVAVEGEPGQADFARGRGRDRRDFRHRRRGGRGGRGGRDFIALDPTLGYANWNYRHNRTALGNGFFGDGMVMGPGRYAYDRGYPYDYYFAPEREVQEEMVLIESAPRPVRCRVEMEVRVCGG
jgi:hypothetical protein